MKLKAVLILLFLFTTVMIAGCYTKLGYYDPASFKEKQQQHVEKTEKELEHASDSDAETEGYYGRRKRIYRPSYTYTEDSYWAPYAPYPYAAYYPPVYHPYPWYYGYGYYGYHVPYYRYYRGYFPYSGYYGRYRGSTYRPTSRGAYKRGVGPREYRPANRRARSSRSVTSSNPRSDRPQRRSRNRNRH